MTQFFRIMCAAFAFTVVFSVESAYAQQPAAKKSDQSVLSNKRESVNRKEKKANSVEAPKRIEKHQREHVVIDLPGYPKYITTGRPEQDEQNYQQAKAEWIKNNADLYQNYLKSQNNKSPRPPVSERRAANPKN